MKRFFGRCLSVALLGMTMVGMGQVAKADLSPSSAQLSNVSTTVKTAGTGVNFNLTVPAIGMNPAVNTNSNTTTIGGLSFHTGTETTPFTLNPVSFYSLALDVRPNNPATGIGFNVQMTSNSPQVSGDAGNPVTPGMGDYAAGAIAWLYNSTLDFGLSLGGDTLFNRLIANQSNNVLAGALQLATWELVYDGSKSPIGLSPVSLDIGSFTATSGPISLNPSPSSDQSAELQLANDFLGAILTSGVDFQLLATGTLSLGNSNNSSTTLDVQNRVTVATPEPATLAMWGLMGSFGAVFATRFNRKRLLARLA